MRASCDGRLECELLSDSGGSWGTAATPARFYNMAWLILLLAGLFEIVWAVGLKFTNGFTRLWPTVGTLAALVISFGLLGIAAKSLPIGTAYAVWTGIGAAGTVICGILLLGEPATAMRLACVGLIVAGVVGLKFA